MALCAVAGLVLASAAPQALGGEGEEPFVVSSSLSAQQVGPGETFELTVSFTLGEGVHLYKDKIEFTWEELSGAKALEVVKPKGKDFPDLTTMEEGDTIEAYEGSVDVVVRFEATGEAGGTAVLKGEVGYQGCTDVMCYRPMTEPIAHKLPIGGSAVEAGEPAEAGGLWGYLLRILSAFGAGVLISFTPCVYPMIPVTIAIVAGRGERTKLAAVGRTLVYVLGIAITYAVAGLVVAAVGAQAQSFIQSAWFRVPIAVLFVALALSMFDVITIQMPGAGSGLTDRVASKVSGIPGVFALGIVSGLIVGPCATAPLAGMLAYIARTGDRWLGFWMLFAMAWGMGLILIVAGVSTAALPKAGGWMVWVKKLLGFVMLWAAAYFLSPYIGSTAYYLATALVLLAAAVFLGGLDALGSEAGFGARMKRLVGLLAVFAALIFLLAASPPILARLGVDLAAGGGGGAEAAQAPPAASAEPGERDGPFVWADAAMVDAAIASDRPVVLDFWATWCAVCKQMDRTTFQDPRVVEELGRFAALKIDFDKHTGLADRFGVRTAPAYIFFDSQGNELEDLRINEKTGADAFLKTLGQVE